MFKNFLCVVLMLGMLFCLTACFAETENVPEPTEKTIQQIATEAQSTTEVSATTEKQTTTQKTADDELSPDFKAAMDSYENFMNEYVVFMKKYADNPSDTTLLADYAQYMSDYAEFVKDFEEWDEEVMNEAELAYYIDVQTRVNQKLLEIS